ncbi:MAG: VWA domain-containing protein [Flavobacteriales bacterium]|nr:VWA domain-containing protein [Flavobacteriales bacterium]
MITFSNTWMFYALLAIPAWIMALILFLKWKKNKMALLASGVLQPKMFPRYSRFKIVLKHILFILSYTMLVVALARPKMGMKVQDVETKGADIIIALDVSNSMLAEDLKPNRLERAKQAISVLLDRLRGDRIGIIVFAGSARKQVPITIDYATAKMTVQSITPDDVNTQGTSLSAAINMAMESLPVDRASSGAIILITDGEDHEGEAVELARKAKKQNVFVHTIGIGTPQGVPIPIYNNGLVSGYKTDRNGQTVITKLNEQILKEIASEGGGIYVKGNNPTLALDQIKKEIDRMDKQVVSMKRYEDGKEQFQWPLALAIFLIILEGFISEQSTGMLTRMDFLTPKR